MVANDNHECDGCLMDRACLFYINGEWVPPRSGRTLAVIEPATGAAFTSIALADEEDVDRAVKAAGACFDAGWGEQTPNVRLDLLETLIDVVARRRDTFAELISREMGAPIDFARTSQVDAALGHLRAIAAAGRRTSLDTPVAPDRPADRVRFEPIGVAALITPWNWPINQIALKVGAALAAGCTMVLKPSELAPLSPLLFAECLHEAGVPPGVFNLINGDGADTGSALTAHADVDIVSFTGSTRAGALVAHAAADRIAHVSLELGGKSPNLVFADCNLETAIRQGVAHCFRNAGQSCNAASRMLVERSVYERAVLLAADAAENTNVDLPEQPGNHLGPVISQRQFDRVQAYIASGLEEGARLVAGGPGRFPGLEAGYFVRPTIFADVTGDMTVAREEIFGPVLVMTPFDSEDEAVALANDTDYGLAAYVQTTDPRRADRVAKRLQAGMIQINGVSRAPGAPFGGRKRSGIGREGGLWGIREFQAVKSISGAVHLEDG